MIKKGIELQIISPSALIRENCYAVFKVDKRFSVCSVCRSKSVFLCHLICKYRKATYDELLNDKGIKNNESNDFNCRYSFKPILDDKEI